MGMGKKNCRDKIYPGNSFDFNLYFLTQGFSLGNPRGTGNPVILPLFLPRLKPWVRKLGCSKLAVLKLVFFKLKPTPK
jgi:hypothetical protein